MKTGIFLLAMLTALTIKAQSKNELCGTVEGDSFVNSETVVMSIYNPLEGEFVEKTVVALTPAAQEFLSVASVHGASFCNTNAPREAPFKICFVGNLKKGQAQSFTCGEVKRCRGFNCGGNGFSVNSGRRR